MAEQKTGNKVLFTRVVYKKSPNGRIIGSWEVSSEAFEMVGGNGEQHKGKYLKIVQHKSEFGREGQAGYKPSKSTTITIDLGNKELREVISEAFKA